MQTIRLIQSDWGGKAHEALGPLALYGIPNETIKVMDRAQFKRLCDEAKSTSAITLVLLGQGFLNQLGKKLMQQIPPDSERLKVIWIGIDPGDNSAWGYRVPADGSVGVTVLEALGQSTSLLNEVTASINDALKPRFADAILSFTEYYCYDSDTDLELHLPVVEVKDHFERGDLRDWLQALVKEADEANA